MPNARKSLSAFASSILLAASALVASPAPAQTGDGNPSGSDIYCCSVSGCAFYYMSGPGTSCCYWAGYAWWAQTNHWDLERCTLPMFQSPGEADDTAAPTYSEPAGK